MTFTTILSSVVHRKPRTVELRRRAWSRDPASDDFHRPLRIDRDSYVMAVSCHGCVWDRPALSVTDYLADDWEVRNVDNE
jgi:hypothetical protein